MIGGRLQDCAAVSRLAPHPRAGFTLFEMVLVLVVLLVALSISWPALARIYTEYQLRQAAELVEVRLSAARVYSIETGLVYQFRYEPGGQRFLVIPAEAAPAGEASQAARVSGVFPTSVPRFETIGWVAGVGEQLPAATLSGLPGSQELAIVRWSPPILFNPDGTATTASFAVNDQRGKSVSVSVRGLTGGVSISGINAEGSP